jgi:hypothetical protein
MRSSKKGVGEECGGGLDGVGREECEEGIGKEKD